MEYKERVKYDICGKSFYSKKTLEQHSKDTHSTADKRGIKGYEYMSTLNKSDMIKKYTNSNR